MPNRRPRPRPPRPNKSLTLTRPSATLSHRMGEGRGEGVFFVNASSLGKSTWAFPNSPRAFCKSPLPFGKDPFPFWKSDGRVEAGDVAFGKRKGGAGDGAVALNEGAGDFWKGEVAFRGGGIAFHQGDGGVGVGAGAFAEGGNAYADGGRRKLQVHHRRVAVEREGTGVLDFHVHELTLMAGAAVEQHDAVA